MSEEIEKYYKVFAEKKLTEFFDYKQEKPYIIKELTHEEKELKYGKTQEFTFKVLVSGSAEWKEAKCVFPSSIITRLLNIEKEAKEGLAGKEFYMNYTGTSKANTGREQHNIYLEEIEVS